jgi:Asp-tRNA(Asn)/Glu-tRNA(Gln) amidotransferase A subunit family amidase
MLKHTQLFNLTGHPAITIPVPSGGLPVGLQLVGRRGGTAGLLAIAAACEGVLRA